MEVSIAEGTLWAGEMVTIEMSMAEAEILLYNDTALHLLRDAVREAMSD